MGIGTIWKVILILPHYDHQLLSGLFQKRLRSTRPFIRNKHGHFPGKYMSRPQNTAGVRWIRGNGLMIAEVIHLSKPNCVILTGHSGYLKIAPYWNTLYIYTCLHAIFHNGLASIPEGILHMSCGKVAFKIDRIASSLSSHSPEELISKSFDYVLAKGKTPAQILEQLKHAPVRTNVVTPFHWLESRWQNSQTVISVRMPSKICVNFIAMSDHLTPTGYINNYKHICGMYS